MISIRVLTATTLMLMSTVCLTSFAVGADQMIVVHLKGEATGETRPIPVIEETGTTEGNCFDVELLDPKDNSQLGTASRCFTDTQSTQDGIALTETSFFTLQGGTIVARSRVTIQPLLETVDNMTHLIGAVPAAYVNNLLVDHNSGQFQGMSGRLRSGGVVDLSNFRENNKLVFDDIAVITFVDNREQVKRVQALLEEANMYTGDIDGIFGPNTASALRQYQTKHGLPVTGELDEATRKALSIP
jgi:hypothetical protein